MRMRYLFPIFLVLVFLWSCGDDPTTTDNIGTDENQPAALPVQKGPSAPVLTKPALPQSRWVGNPFQYAHVFREGFEIVEVARIIPAGAGPDYSVKRDASDPGTDPMELGRLRKKEDGMPYSGEVLRHFLSGKLEHYSKYQDGFRVGTAYWWDEQGGTAKVMKGWGGHSEPIDPSAVSPETYESFSKLLGSVDTSDSEAFIFSGTQKTWSKWAWETTEIGSDQPVKFQSETGSHLNGQVRIYSEQGELKSVQTYDDGYLEGVRKEYYENGVQSLLCEFKAGLKEGKETWWSESGLKSYEAHHKDGKLEGLNTTWDNEGKILSQLRYENGEAVERLVENGEAVKP
jgi:antitoxin component YwqK of YwqJK toxin-antitoxin module